MRFHFFRTVRSLGAPNLLSIFRIILIPVFVIFFFSGIMYADIYAAAVLAISGITDILDGFVARRFQLVSELGHILDPLADKMTQMIVCICLVIRHTALLWVLCLLILKEMIMIAASVYIVKTGKKMFPSKWYGKLGTATFYFVIIAIIVFELPDRTANILLGSVLGYMLFSLVMYIPTYIKTISKQD